MKKIGLFILIIILAGIFCFLAMRLIDNKNEINLQVANNEEEAGKIDDKTIIPEIETDNTIKEKTLNLYGT